MDNGFFSTIFGFISQFFLGKDIEKKDIMPVYIKAHGNYKSNVSIGKNWIDVYQKKLQISLELSTRFCENPSKIAIRSSSDSIFEEVILLVEAEGYSDGNFKSDHYTAQQTLVFKDVGYRPKIKSLTDIPPIDYWTLENGNVLFSYKDFSVTVVSISENGQLQMIQQKKKLFSLCNIKDLVDPPTQL